VIQHNASLFAKDSLVGSLGTTILGSTRDSVVAQMMLHWAEPTKHPNKILSSSAKERNASIQKQHEN